MSALTSTKSQFLWSEGAQSAFVRLKQLFTSAPILVSPDPEKQFIVEVDASNVGVGAILSQSSSTDNKVHPCAFFSHCLSPAEQNYDVGNHELLAIRLALGEWRHWLEGAKLPFVVWTDHRNLEYIRSAKRLNARQARWALVFGVLTFRFLTAPALRILNPTPFHDSSAPQRTFRPRRSSFLKHVWSELPSGESSRPSGGLFHARLDLPPLLRGDYSYQRSVRFGSFGYSSLGSLF